ncbi:MAG: hypothetical protein JM58_04085 [Peptococcaceae bacterium BICA1-8]|nr:MAG: hypothetical protein JM58_04085 [Peptococcaceae bacterium BICA1-8]
MSDGFWQNKTMDILRTSLDAVSLRHKTISNNIANINTPNYKRQLVNFEEELGKHLLNSQKITPLRKTNPQHITSENRDYSVIKPEVKEDKAILRTDGNNVDIDLELSILAENTVKFNVLSQTINGKFSQLKSVIRGGR